MKRLLMVCLGVLVLTSFALADDIFPPTWRGQDGSIVSEWDTWNGFRSAILPDSISGNPSVPAGPTNAVAATSTYLYSTFQNRSNVLVISGVQDGIIFNLDNFDTPNPYKLIRVQITYNITDAAAGIPNGFDVVTPNSTDILYAPNLVATTVADADGWITSAYDFTLQPNPTQESIGLKFVSRMGEQYPFTAFIDQVVIDTRCIPEPATMSLLILGGLTLLRRRKE